MKTNVLIIGAGGVAKVVAHKCAQNNDVLGDIHVASRTLDKVLFIMDSIRIKQSMKEQGRLTAHRLDARNVDALKSVIVSAGIQIVINAGPSFLNMGVLQACIDTGAAYIDTAIHEEADKVCETPPWYANHEWTRRDACRDAGVTAILGAGFDPGVVNAYARLAYDEHFDRVDSIDIVDINAGRHGRYFATNFDPEINFREFTGSVWSWQEGQWRANEMFQVGRQWDLPVVGKQQTYLTGHDEIHSLSQILKVPTVRFWMGFSYHYINVFTVLNKLGLLSAHPVRTAEGVEVAPLKIVKAVLPDPASLAPAYHGQTCIGVEVRGVQHGGPNEVFIYNVMDHQQAYAEVGSQAISYTAGVPAAAAAILVARGEWDIEQMANVEELPPRPFLALLSQMGLPSRIRDGMGDRPLASGQQEAAKTLDDAPVAR